MAFWFSSWLLPTQASVLPSGDGKSCSTTISSLKRGEFPACRHLPAANRPGCGHDGIAVRGKCHALPSTSHGTGDVTN
jgi:hypothetical protein